MKIQKKKFPKKYYDERLDKHSGQQVDIDMLVLHCSAYETEKLTQVFVDLGVSVHYLIEQDGSIIQLMDESKRVWHAGSGTWYGIEDINAHSIGIELINPSLGHSIPYTLAQIDSLTELSKDIIKRYNILPHNVFAHSDMAPTRKYDPGRLFPWEALSKEGIGLWPSEEVLENQTKDIKSLLETIGYPTENEEAALRAFWRHFMPQMIPDKECQGIDQYQFLLKYDQNLPSILKMQASADEKIVQRLNQVASAFEKSRNRIG